MVKKKRGAELKPGGILADFRASCQLVMRLAAGLETNASFVTIRAAKARTDCLCENVMRRTSYRHLMGYFIVGFVVVATLGARHWAFDRLQQQWASRYVNRLTDMPQDRAVRLVQQLAASQDPWLNVIVRL